MRIAYIEKNFQPKTMDMLHIAERIIDEYQAQGFNLTLRQLYYQFVARGLIENTERSYKRLGSIINDGRMAGIIDWESIEDRTRNVKIKLRLDSPAEGIELVKNQYCIDMWENQPRRVEVWVEKEALAGVVARVCNRNDVPYFSCRGYVSQSEQWRAGQRIANQQFTVVLHLGDHDPSGIDMTRDNFDRLDMFSDENVCVERIALNWEQIEEFKPPPNPTKLTDSRAKRYVREYGNESWELDALEPKYIEQIIQEHITDLRVPSLWEERQEVLAEDMATFQTIIEGLDK